ncbi:MAG: ATP-binding cassette domain-containing protein [Bacteroidia bacterium]
MLSLYINAEEILVKRKRIPVGLNIRLTSGEDLLISGANGSGKTMLFKALAGLIPFTGEFRIENEKEPTQNQNLISFCIENYFEPNLTASDNLAIARYIKNDRTQFINNLMEGLNFSTQLNKKCGSLSAGNKKKLHIIAAFVGQPKMVFLDEPFANLDENSAGSLLNWFKDHLSHGGILIYNDPAADSVVRAKYSYKLPGHEAS